MKQCVLNIEYCNQFPYHCPFYGQTVRPDKMVEQVCRNTPVGVPLKILRIRDESMAARVKKITPPGWCSLPEVKNDAS